MIIRAKAIINKLKNYRYYRSIEELYAIELGKLENELKKKNDNNRELAVVLHLYYQDSWKYIESKLKIIPEKFDLFVSVPEENKKLEREIKKTFQGANIIHTPNLGRDILPFLKIMSVVKRFNNYRVVLKIHTKRSLHRDDGEDWNNEIMNELIPNNRGLITKNIEKLLTDNSALTGPSKQYINLSVNFEANGRDLTKIMMHSFRNHRLIWRVLQTDRKEYGFFAGSMFWINIAKLSQAFDEKNSKAKYFARERGQVDGTYAHAMERAFSLIPEVNRDYLLKIDELKINKIKDYSGAFPDWYSPEQSSD
jgi:lipopolysaccharide biosynthesis protein